MKKRRAALRKSGRCGWAICRKRMTMHDKLPERLITILETNIFEAANHSEKFHCCLCTRMRRRQEDTIC